MRKPEGVSCRDCRWWWWYGGLCTVHEEILELGIDPMSPEAIEDCDQFEIKTHSEDESIRFSYDRLPSLETIELVRRIRNKEYDDLIRRIKTGDN